MNDWKCCASQIWGLHSSVREGPSPSECYAVSNCEYLLTFWRIVMPLWDPKGLEHLKIQFLIIFEHMWSTHSIWSLQSAVLVSASDMCVCVCVCVCARYRSSCLALVSVYAGSRNMSIFPNASRIFQTGLTCQRNIFPAGTCSIETSVCPANMQQVQFEVFLLRLMQSNCLQDMSCRMWLFCAAFFMYAFCPKTIIV
jgi:hypothetical protein